MTATRQFVGQLAHEVRGLEPVVDEVLDVARGWPAALAEPGLRRQLADLWSAVVEVDPVAGSVVRSLVAHLLADAQPDPASAHAWDQRSLDLLGPGLRQHRRRDLRHAAISCLPSTYLSLALTAEGVGLLRAARRYADCACRFEPVLDAGPYAEAIALQTARTSRRLALKIGGRP